MRVDRRRGFESAQDRRDALPTSLRKAALGLGILVILAMIVQPRPFGGLATYFFWKQDFALSIVVIAGLLGFSIVPIRQSGGISRRADSVIAFLLVLVAASIAFAGAMVVFEHYPLSRDEAMSVFAARYLANGMLGWPIPHSLSSMADAMLPQFAVRQGDYWVSPYLPGYALLEAGISRISGTVWLTGPLCIIAGVAGIWSAAGRLWPGRREAQIVAIVLATTSTQLLVTGMTAYAMSGHFALDALWLAAFLRRDKAGHAMAICLSFLALGLHEYAHHMIFLSGMLVWLCMIRHRQLALLYGISSILSVMFWRFGYPAALDTILGPHGSTVTVHTFSGYLDRISDMNPVTYLVRFIAWQNILLLPLCVCGWFSVRGDRENPLFGITLSIFAGLLFLIDQGHGWGYRYLSGLIPNICLLATAGWFRFGASLSDGVRTGAPRWMLWTSVVVALLVTLPIAAVTSRAFAAPYAHAYQRLTSADADVVVLDTSGYQYANDLIHFDDARHRPILLDAGKLKAPDVVSLCRDKRVLMFTGVQAAQLGIASVSSEEEYNRSAHETRRLMSALHCGQPFPLR